MAFKIFRKNCCGLDVHKTWIYACIGITDTNGRTEYKQARFSSFTKGLQELADWLAKYDCKINIFLSLFIQNRGVRNQFQRHLLPIVNMNQITPVRRVIL